MDTIVSMTGRLGTDVERKTSRHGTDYIKFRLGTTRRIQRDGEWVDGDTTWVSVRCYRQLAVNANFSLQKGDPIVVVGRLRVETWVTDAGVQRENTVLDADAIGHDLTWGTSRYRRAERRYSGEVVCEQPLEREVVDPETGEVIDLVSGEVCAADAAPQGAAQGI
jgi:single-strand DNA-binding protein